MTDDPKFFVEGVSSCDVSEGFAGNAWFIAAVSALARQKFLFNKVRANEIRPFCMRLMKHAQSSSGSSRNTLQTKKPYITDIQTFRVSAGGSKRCGTSVAAPSGIGEEDQIHVLWPLPIFLLSLRRMATGGETLSASGMICISIRIMTQRNSLFGDVPRKLR